jgi:hypothetical protein
MTRRIDFTQEGASWLKALLHEQKQERFALCASAKAVPLVLTFWLLMVGCATKQQDDGARTTNTTTTAAAGPAARTGSTTGEYPDTQAGAEALLVEFVKPGADHAALTNRLRPTNADLEAIFVPGLAARANALYGPAWDSGQLVVAPMADQTQVKVVSATSEEIKSGTGGAADFPGGWRDVADQLKPGIRFYRFTFLEPGKDRGMAYDGLVHVNGNWRIAPKPWRAR